MNGILEIYADKIHAGTLFGQGNSISGSSTFAYAGEWLSRPDAYPLSPDIPLNEKSTHFYGDPQMPGAIEDAGPDSWGKRLIHATHRGKEMSEFDIIAAVDDRLRMGNLRIYSDGQPVTVKVDPLPSLDTALQAAEYAGNLDAMTDDQLKLVADAGSSLGGARPKVNVNDQDFGLSILKFPRQHEDDDTEAWEFVALSCANQAGIPTPEHRHLRVDDFNSALLVKRFDRENNRRIGYISARSALSLRANDSYSYEELANKIDILCVDPEKDKRSLFDRIALSIIFDNVDDHMRNHGFLREKEGWALSPAFDITPQWQGWRTDATPITYGQSGFNRTLEQLEESSEKLGIPRQEAKHRIAAVADACSNFMQIAKDLRIAYIDESNMAKNISKKIEEATPLAVSVPKRKETPPPGKIWVKEHNRGGKLVPGYWRTAPNK